jgi:hypothetical protein
LNYAHVGALGIITIPHNAEGNSMSTIRQTLILITLLLIGNLLAAAQTLAAVEKLSDAQWSFKAAPEKAMTILSF